METSTIIWIIVAVVVVLALVGLFGWLANKRRAEAHRTQAGELRHEAAARAGGMQDADLDAREARADADQARLAADRAEERASEKQRAVEQEQAAVEGRVREADRLDPDVDHKADDYSPTTPEDPGRPV